MFQRNILIVLLLWSFSASLCGCNPEVSFDVPLKAPTTVKGASLLENLIGDMGFSSFLNVDFSATQEFKNNNTAKEHVKSATLTSLQLKITTPTDQNFDFLQKIEFYVSAPGLEKKLVATKEIPKGVREFSLDLIKLELAPYVRAASVSFTTKVNGRKPKKDTTIEASARFHIVAQAFVEKK